MLRNCSRGSNPGDGAIVGALTWGACVSPGAGRSWIFGRSWDFTPHLLSLLLSGRESSKERLALILPFNYLIAVDLGFLHSFVLNELLLGHLASALQRTCVDDSFRSGHQKRLSGTGAACGRCDVAAAAHVLAISSRASTDCVLANLSARSSVFAVRSRSGIKP